MNIASELLDNIFEEFNQLGLIRRVQTSRSLAQFCNLLVMRMEL